MKYVILVSHGEFASGLKNALGMLAGKRADLLAAGLQDGRSADDFAQDFEALIEPIGDGDEVLLLGDLIGGSPLTTACNVLCEKGLAANTRVIGGMNLPLALTALLMKDSIDLDTLKESISEQARDTLKEFVLSTEDEDEDDV